MKPLDPRAVQIHPAGHLSCTWEVRVPCSYERLFRPDVWVDIEALMKGRGGGRKPKPGDLLRCIHAEGSFDVTCIVHAVSSGYVLKFYCGIVPDGVERVLEDLGTLRTTDDVKEAAKRWRAAGVSKEDLATARRTFSKAHHPDTGAADSRALGLANAALDQAAGALSEANP